MSITMSPVALLPPSPVDEPLWRLSVEQYHQMIDAGILTDEDPVELLDGCLVQKMPKNPVHSLVTGELRDRFARMLPAGYFANSQEPVTLPTSEPEPDVSVIRGRRRDFGKCHPRVTDTALLTEVSETSLARDRGSKKRIYAQADLVQYWIINLVDRQIEVHSDPDAAAGSYRQHTVYGLSEDAPVVIDGQLIGTLRLEQLLPPQ